MENDLKNNKTDFEKSNHRFIRTWNNKAPCRSYLAYCIQIKLFLSLNSKFKLGLKSILTHCNFFLCIQYSLFRLVDRVHFLLKKEKKLVWKFNQYIHTVLINLNVWAHSLIILNVECTNFAIVEKIFNESQIMWYIEFKSILWTRTVAVSNNKMS